MLPGPQERGSWAQQVVLGLWLPMSKGERDFALLGWALLPFPSNPIIPDAVYVSDTSEALALE